jgi:hypothetical protein
LPARLLALALALGSGASGCQGGPLEPAVGTGFEPGGSGTATAPPAAPPNGPPNPSISAPEAGATFTYGTPINFRGSATDPEDGSIPDAALAWASDQDGSLGTGGSLTRSDLSVGEHAVTLRATDSHGTDASVSVQVVVLAPPPPPPPPPPTPSSSSPGFDIEIRYVGGTPTHSAAFSAAAARWEEIITGDVPDAAVDFAGGSCHGPIEETIDDLVIFVVVGPIDGLGGALGEAGPCLVRSGSKLPITGQLTLDSDDLEQAGELGVLADLVLHEMGHVLGFGTLWETLDLLEGAGQADPQFTGDQARQAFDGIGGGAYAGTAVPVEDSGGTGTRDGHWRESVFGTELMTGWLNVGALNRLSSVTAASLGDVGYDVDPAAADAFSLSLAAIARPRPAIWVGDDLSRAPVLAVDPAGRILKLEP